MSYSRNISSDLIWNGSQYNTISSTKPANLYAWNKMGSILSGDKFAYTASSTPNIGDLVYNSNGELTDYTVQYIINENTITIEECLIIFKLTPSNAKVDVVVNGEIFHDLILSIPYGSTATYTVYGEGYKAKTGTITTTTPYQVFEVSLEEPSKSYTITYDDTDYTSTDVSEGHGLVINTIRADKTEVDLGNDFTIVEN